MPEETEKKPSRVASVARDILDYVLNDVLIPTTKRMVSDVVSQTVEIALFGTTTSRSSSYGGGRRDRVSYERYYSDRNRIPVRTRSRLAKVTFPDRSDATQVLADLRENARRYGTATVHEYYTMSGHKAEYTDNSRGWNERDLDSAAVGYSRDGWTIDLPSPRDL